MKMCQKHWDRLIELIKERGMWSLVGGPETARAELQAAIDGDPEREFDPLLRANSMVMSQALSMGGLYLMSAKPDGSEYCPICEAVTHMSQVPLQPGGPPAGEQWVENHWTVGVVDSIQQLLRERGVLPKVQ